MVKGTRDFQGTDSPDVPINFCYSSAHTFLRLFLETKALSSFSFGSGAQDARRTPDAVPGVLRTWIETLGRLRELEEFQAVIASELACRPEGRQTIQGPRTTR
jgi:hypothetical protein